MSEKMKTCKVCGKEFANSAKTCPHCGAKNTKPIFKKWWFWVLIVIIVGAISSAGGNDGTTNDTNTDETKGSTSVSATHSDFDGDCGIEASAEIGNNIINYPELTITVTNTSDKEIAAIKFYAVPYDVYGDEIKGWTTQKNLYTDNSIGVGKTDTISYQFIEDTIKTVKLYIYSVYFSDGTEWGNKDATSSKIIKNAPQIEVLVKE